MSLIFKYYLYFLSILYEILNFNTNNRSKIILILEKLLHHNQIIVRQS